MSTVTFENVCRVHTKRQVIIKMRKFNMFITAVCVLFLIKLLTFVANFWPGTGALNNIYLAAPNTTRDSKST